MTRRLNWNHGPALKATVAITAAVMTKLRPTPHRLQTVLAPAQEAVAVALRKALLLPLDNLLSVAREFLNPNFSHSGLDRCLWGGSTGGHRSARRNPL